MRASAAVCLVVAVVFAGLALAAFAGRTVAREFLSIRQTAEQTVVAWVERVMPEKTASSQTKIDAKYKQELARTRERLKSIEMEREKLEARVRGTGEAASQAGLEVNRHCQHVEHRVWRNGSAVRHLRFAFLLASKENAKTWD